MWNPLHRTGAFAAVIHVDNDISVAAIVVELFLRLEGRLISAALHPVIEDLTLISCLLCALEFLCRGGFVSA